MLAIERPAAAALPRSLLWGESRDAFILPRFREFYAEVIRLKRRVRTAGAPLAIAAGREPGEESADLVEQRLLALLEQQALDCARLAGEPAAKLYKDAQYVMAALADETFLNLEWDGRAVWASRLLEHRLFGTSIAGEFIFRRLEQFLDRREPAHTEVATVYLLALSLGFEGKFRNRRDRSALEGYRQRLTTAILGAGPGALAAGHPLFPDAGADMPSGTVPVRLPWVRRWSLVLAVTLAAYLVVSHFLWRDLTRPLYRLNECIQARAGANSAAARDLLRARLAACDE